MAAGSKFNIVITAVDNFSTKINKINRRLADINQPIHKFGKAVRDFSKESGVKNMVKELGETAKAAEKVAAKVTSIIAPMASVFGIASIGAVAAMADKWGQFARNLTLTSQYTNLSTSQVSDLTGAARLLGIETATTSATLVTFGDNLEDALYGRNNDYLAFMTQLGIKIGTFGGGLEDEGKLLEEFADKYQNMANTPGMGHSAAHKAASLAGLSAIEPLLIKGGAYIRQLKEIQALYGFKPNPTQIAAGDRFYLTTQKARAAVAGLASSIGDKLVPVLGPLIEQFANFIAANRELISQDVAKVFSALALAIKSVNWVRLFHEIHTVLSVINHIVTATVGWKYAIIGWIAVSTGLLPLLWGLTVAVLRLGAALLLTPVGWVILGLTALSVAAYEVWKHWDWFVKQWDKIWASIDRIASSVIIKLSNMMPDFVGMPMQRLGMRIQGNNPDVATPFARDDRNVASRWWDWINHRNASSSTSGVTAPGPYGGASSASPLFSRDPSLGASDADPSGRVNVDIVFHNMPKGVGYAVAKSGGVMATARQQSAMPSLVSP